jgi:UDP-GlcNAc:undecaprenyl-phosphate GlcNAc-1-phosphate transferase
VNAIAAAAALPVAALVLAGLLRAPAGGRVGRRLVAAPSGERWHVRATPTFGGVGIFLGLLAGVGAAVAVGAVDAGSELAGIVAGAAILFVAGFVDDVRALSPVAKLAAQFAAAGVVLASGLTVEVVGNDLIATALGLLWLVGITNAFNLLDNMDGLAASLATVACAVLAVDAVYADEGELALVVALALGAACAGFLPFNLRPGRKAAVFMGDSGSQVIGFGLASVALASSWTTAGATLTSLLLPLLVLAIPILDTAFVTMRRAVERRPVTQGGTDHSSHRLVYYGLSEQQAVFALTLLAALLGATALAYNVLANARVTAVGVLLSFVVLVQFASFLSDLEERSRRHESGPAPSLWRAFVSQPRRLVEVLVDFAIVCASFLCAYLLFVDDGGDDVQRAVFLATLPVLLAVRYVLFVLFGIYRRVWRFASARDLFAIAAAVALSVPPTVAVIAKTQQLEAFPAEVFVVDALLCAALVAASRLALRSLPGFAARTSRADRTRVVVVGAGRSGRALARELAETPDHRVVGFVDDNTGLRRRRIHGITVRGTLEDLPRLLAATRVDEVLVTIPDAAPGRLAAVIEACDAAGVSCRFVRREIAPPPLRARASVE